MEAIMTFVQPFFIWLLQTTLIGSVVIGLILAAQKAMGGKLGPRWCHALWLVLLIRLALPGAFPGQIDLSTILSLRGTGRFNNSSHLKQLNRTRSLKQIRNRSPASEFRSR